MKLEDLRIRISKCNRCGKNKFWYFPTINGVKGFYGDKDYIFAATQPHLGRFPNTQNDRRLYSSMAKYGFKKAHLTDVVKCRGEKYKELTKREIDNCIGWLDEEVKIVKPKAIIAFGRKAFGALMSIRRFRPVLLVTHYSARKSDADYEEEFKTLRSCLDSDSYRHGMKIRHMIGQEPGEMEKPNEKYRQFVSLLNELRKEGKISAERWRKLNTQLIKEPHTRTMLLEHLKRLQKN